MFITSLFEEPTQPKKQAVVAFGRLNPPTVGHKKLIDAMAKMPGDAFLFLSHTQKPKDNPLSFAEKKHFAEKFFPGVTIGDESVRTPIDMLKKLEELGYSSVTYVAGSDRVEAFTKLLNDYNGKEYSFENITVVSAGERDPDADGVEGMSASKMRAAAKEGDFAAFKQGVPVPSLAKELYNAVRKGMKIVDEGIVKNVKRAITGKAAGQRSWELVNKWADEPNEQTKAQLLKHAKRFDRVSRGKDAFKEAKPGFVGEGIGKSGLGPEVWYKGRLVGWKTSEKDGRTLFQPDTRELPGDEGRILSLPTDAVSIREGKTEVKESMGPVNDGAVIIKTKSGKQVGEVYQTDDGSWGCLHYKLDMGADGMDSKEEAIEELTIMHQDLGGKGNLREGGYKFKGSFPFDVDHMPGAVRRDVDMATDSVPTKDKAHWQRAVDSINSRLFDDNSDYISDNRRETVEHNNVTWAFWDKVKNVGWFHAKGRAVKPYRLGEDIQESNWERDRNGGYVNRHTGVRSAFPDNRDHSSYMTPEYMIDVYTKRLAEIERGPYKRTKEVERIKRRLAKLQGQHTTVHSYTKESAQKKIHTKVRIVKGPKHAIGKIGTIGEVRHGLYKGAPKMYTVDYPADDGHITSIQLPKEALRIVKDSEESQPLIREAGDSAHSPDEMLQRVNAAIKQKEAKLSAAVKAYNQLTQVDESALENAEYVDIWAMQEEDIRQHLLTTPKLFEGTADYTTLQQFLSLHSTKEPVVGQEYVYTSIFSLLPGKVLSIAHFSQPHRLVKLENGTAYFSVNGAIRKFPETGTMSGDMLKWVFMFGSVNELEKFKTMLNLKFSEWSLKDKIIQESAGSDGGGKPRVRGYYNNSGEKKFEVLNSKGVRVNSAEFTTRKAALDYMMSKWPTL